MRTITFIFGILLMHVSWSQDKNTNIEGGMGIQGYDPVAYFTDNKALEGEKTITSTHQGVKYYFSNSKNKDLFDRNPSKYLPAYGGWCAYAMAGGEKVKIDPETFKIIDGKLYLFYNFYFNNTLTKWNKDEANLKRQADQHWARISK
ncbi:MAG: YHS domain-containing protein [Cyclobacteriaceae bacterium]|nr:YHS domain-containing protein [Cyclobacteriaceae bacterium SS2]